MGQVMAVCTSKCKGMSKRNVGGAICVGNSIEVIG